MLDVFSWSLTWPHTVVAILFGYLLGSIPFGILTTRLFGLGDVRKIGSGNIGATNVLRTGNKSVAALTLAGDILKGAVAAALAAEWSQDAGIAAGFAAFVGHLFPVWLAFKGGKGVATYIGVLLGLFWPAALAFVAVWLAVAAITRYSSLSALIATAAAPVILFGLGEPKLALLFAVLTVLAWLKHHANIARLLAGTETRIGSKE